MARFRISAEKPLVKHVAFATYTLVALYCCQMANESKLCFQSHRETRVRSTS